MLEERRTLMLTVPLTRSLTRRSVILLAGAGVASLSRGYGFGGKEFWETKDPAEWNSEDIARILSKSPWAKATLAERTKTEKNNMPSISNPSTIPGTRSPRNSGGIGGLGGPASRMPGGSGRNRNPPNRTVTTYKGTVLWESAAPVRAALKTKLPEGLDGQYVLGVSGVPLTKLDSKGALERIRQVTTLHTKGGQPLEAAAVQEDTTNGTVYLFGFSREALTLSKNDKEVVFTTHMGKLAFTAKFNPKEMLYHGELAV